MNFRRVISLEEDKKFDEALIQLNSIINQEKTIEKKEYYKTYLQRLIERIEAYSPYEGLFIKQIFKEYKTLDRNSEAPVITLTAISGRLEGLFKTIDSILKQSLTPASINLFISEEPYLVDEGFNENDVLLKDLYEKGVNIYFTENIGPYRKQVPIIKLLREKGYPEETIFITIDDDVIYPKDTISALVSNISKTDTVTSYRGREIQLENSAIATYKKFTKPIENISAFNLGTGKNGIAYKLKYFPKNGENYVGSLIAPTADDIWCKWVTGVYCIETTILEPASAFDKTKDFEETAPENKVGLFHVFNAKGRNDIAIEAMEIYFSAKGKSLASILSGLDND